eukprot:TRINITY_DN4203_c0_g1_i3.p3 TRINITY_DN4203_c0_g1~~TRINITY_DN4203_c0_g1_i3.p3  ORF type:complete len:152 (-),score=5.90 TRINITY_DN4203_c0_g1_i3:994-1449(-)
MRVFFQYFFENQFARHLDVKTGRYKKYKKVKKNKCGYYFYFYSFVIFFGEQVIFSKGIKIKQYCTVDITQDKSCNFLAVFFGVNKRLVNQVIFYFFLVFYFKNQKPVGYKNGNFAAFENVPLILLHGMRINLSERFEGNFNISREILILVG